MKAIIRTRMAMIMVAATIMKMIISTRMAMMIVVGNNKIDNNNNKNGNKDGCRQQR